MADTLFTLPGRLGDNIFKLNIVCQYCKQYSTKVDIVMDHQSGKVLSSLVDELPCIENYKLIDGITSYIMGGQPWDFGRDQEFRREYRQVFHLGFKHFPHSNLIMSTFEQSGVQMNPAPLMLESPFPFKHEGIENIVFHFESSEDHRFHDSKNTIMQNLPFFTSKFKCHVIAANKTDESYSDMTGVNIFRDNGRIIDTVRLLTRSLFIGTYSGMWALTANLHFPQISIRNHGCPFSILDPRVEREVLPGDINGIIHHTEEFIRNYASAN